MKKKWEKIIAVLCAATMLVTMPGMRVLADEMQEELIVAADEVPGDTVASEDSLFEDMTDDVDAPITEENIDQVAAEVVGEGPIQVGDGVTATFDTDTGAVEFTSQDGELWRDWVDKLGVDRGKIKSIKVASGTIYLPADSSGYDYNKYYLFGDLENLKSLDLSSLDTSKVTNMRYMFYNCRSLTNLDLSSFDTSNVTIMSCMFDECSSLTTLDLSSFDTSKVTGIDYMFINCNSLETLDLSSFDTSNVTSMSCTFEECSSLTTLDLSSFDTSKVTGMSNMFNGCSSLTTLDLSSFDTSNVRGAEHMFWGCRSLTNLDLSGFDTSNVKNMEFMFAVCSSLTDLDLSSFDTANVTDMWGMFCNCSSLTNLDLSGFDTSNVKSMGYMFDKCSNFQLLLTPKNNSKSIKLPITMYDSAGNSYTSLPNITKSIVIAKTQQMAQEYESSATQTIQTQANQTHYYASNSYGGSGMGASNEEQIREAYTVLASVIDGYMGKLNKTIKAEAKTTSSIQQLREYDETKKQPVLTKPATANDSVVNAAYAGLAEFYNQYRNDHPALDVGKIKLSDSLVTIEAKIIKEIKRSINSYNFNITSNGYNVRVNVMVQGMADMNSPFFGSISVGSTQFVVCSDSKANANAMAWYIKTLTETAEDVSKEGLKAYLVEFNEVTCITSFTEDKFKELFGKIYDYMYAKGYGKISNYSVSLYQGYKISKEITTMKNGNLSEKLKSADSLYKQIKGMSFTDKSIKDEHIKYALSQVEKARADLEQYLYNYIYYPNEPLNKKRGLIDKVGNFFKKITGKCPVDFTIYDEAGNVIGWTEDSYCEFNESIYIEMSGDVENIYVPSEMNVKIVVTATGEGTMSYSIEQYSDGYAVGRMNYYDVPLTEGGTYVQEIPSGALSGDLKQLPLTDQRENQIYGAEFLTSGDSCISNVELWVSEGGTAYGAGEYVRGDLVEVIAYAESGFAFSGWYVGKTLVGTDEVHRFVAKEDVKLEAVFRPLPKDQIISCSESFEKMVGDTSFSLNASTSGDSKLYYYPENEAVAVVSDDGVVTVKSVGTTDILIAANATDNYNAASKVVTLTVKNKTSITPTIKGFSDVQDPKHAYYKAIYWAADAGITKGYSNGTFGINRSCTRGEMMMFLWRYAGKPAPKNVSKSPFKDVPKTHTFYKAILWGSQKGITKGYSDGTFGINRNVSRGECMMFLWRLKGKPAPKAVAKAPFPDVPKSHVFYNAVLWGYQKKITTGFTSGKLKGKFGVNENCSRGQIVTFLYRAK